MCEQTWHHHGRLKQFWLQQCTTLESAVLTCIGLLRFQLHFTCGATLFLSFEVHVRACCDSAVDFTGKKVVSVVVIFKKSKSPVISTCQSKESALPGVFVDFSVARGELPPPRYGCWRLLAHELHRRTESSFASYLSLKLSVFPLHADLLKSFLQRKKQSLPNVRLHVGSSTDRWIRKC